MNVRSNAIKVVFFLLCSENSWGRYLPGDLKALNTHKSGRARRIRLRPRSVGNALTSEYSERQEKLQQLLQQIYQSENTVRKEALEVKRLQDVVAAADKELEEASNQVRSLSTNLQEAQRTAAQRALKSHSAHLQLSAHDQLMFTSRQRVDALSAQAIAIQADIGMWPGAGMYYNVSPPPDQGERQEQVASRVIPQEIVGGYGKAPIIYRNAAVPEPQFYNVVPDGFQLVPVGAG